MTFRKLLALALVASAPTIASAQFTTFIPPKPTVADSVKAVVAAAQKVQADSVAGNQLTNMKTWVDSAAGTAALPTTRADSLAAGVATTQIVDSTAMTMPNGMRAPETASDLPLLALLGLGAVFAGALLLRVPRRERVPARRDSQ